MQRSSADSCTARLALHLREEQPTHLVCANKPELADRLQDLTITVSKLVSELDETATELRAYAAELEQRLETARTESDGLRVRLADGERGLAAAQEELRLADEAVQLATSRAGLTS